jgi:hypothetical protein
VRRYRVRNGDRSEFEIVDVQIVRRRFRVRKGGKSRFRVTRAKLSDTATRGYLARTVVRISLAALAVAWMYALVTGSHDDMRELRQSLMLLVTFVLAYYFGKHGSQ